MLAEFFVVVVVVAVFIFHNKATTKKNDLRNRAPLNKNTTQTKSTQMEMTELRLVYT